MSDEDPKPNTLTVLPDGSIAPRDTTAEVRGLMRAVLKSDLEVVQAADHAWDDDTELERLPARTRRIAQAARLPRKEAPVALTTAHERVMSMMRRESDQPKVTLNVESLTLQLPEKAPPPRVEDAVILDVTETVDD